METETETEMGMGQRHSGSPSSSSEEEEGQRYKMAWSPPPKRPAGRTKFRETRHPVFRGVRRRGGAGRWVCEVRVPGKRGARLWLGTYVTAEAAARAHDAAMLALGGSAPSLNFPDSAWLLAVPPAVLSDLADVRLAATEAVAAFLERQKAANDAASTEATDEATSSVSPPTLAHKAGSSETSQTAGMPAALDSNMFELDFFGEMDYDMYYASLAQGLLMEPPPAATSAHWDINDCGDGVADVTLWSY
ncbi:hypothetical protein GUJ93_ZPchr0009g1912 [Zizania palustris]|uniref:AP2/ERF domain-containing protein n=1 Tax=Zizania palustris TaxID=103762 RepID=A0A8J5RJZ9_ZIZPA|nr:hypothetical protein GUJ93_ZPchr0009g1912 [Zizania palustris]